MAKKSNIKCTYKHWVTSRLEHFASRVVDGNSDDDKDLFDVANEILHLADELEKIMEAPELLADVGTEYDQIARDITSCVVIADVTTHIATHVTVTGVSAERIREAWLRTT